MSVRFDAATDRITYSATSPPNPASGFTLTAWAYVVTNTATNATFARLHASSGGATTVTFATDADGLAGPGYFTGGGSVVATINMAVGAWRRVAMTCLTTTGHVYVATPTGTTQHVSGTVAGTANPTGITLGGRSASDSSEWLNGRLAYVRVWSRQLTQTEIEAEWASATPVSTTSLFADWPLTVATDLTDHSGNGRNMVAGTTAVTTEADPTLTSAVNLPDTPRAALAVGGRESLVVDRFVAVSPGVVLLAGVSQTVTVGRVVFDRSGSVSVGGAGQTLAVGRVLQDTAGFVSASGRTEVVVTDRVVTDHPVAVQAGSPATGLAVDRLVADRPTPVLAGGPLTEQVSVITPVTLTDRPSAVSAAGGGQTLVVDRLVADRPTPVFAAGGTQQVSAAAPVTVTDHPGAAVAGGTGQSLIADRVLADRPSSVNGHTPPQVVRVDVIRSDRAGHVTAGSSPGEQISSGFGDHPAAVSAGGPGQIVVVDVIRHDRPGHVAASGTPTLLAHDVTLADRPWQVLAVNLGQTVVAGQPVPTNWPPAIAGPVSAPLVLVSGPQDAPLVLVSAPVAAPLVLVSGPRATTGSGASELPMMSRRGLSRRSLPAEADEFVVAQFRALRERRRAAKIRRANP